MAEETTGEYYFSFWILSLEALQVIDEAIHGNTEVFLGIVTHGCLFGQEGVLNGVDRQGVIFLVSTIGSLTVHSPTRTDADITEPNVEVQGMLIGCHDELDREPMVGILSLVHNHVGWICWIVTYVITA